MRVLYLLWAVYCAILFFMKAKEIIHIIQSLVCSPGEYRKAAKP